MNYFPLATKIACAGIKPSKSEVYLLAAELQDMHRFSLFKEAVISALMSYDYDYYYDYYNHYDYNYDYDYYYYDYHNYYDYYDYDYDYYYSPEEKVIALLMLSAMYSNKKE